MHFLGSFLLQNMFFSLQVFPFAEQNMKFTVKVLLTCILYCNTGPGCDYRTVCKYRRLILITDIIFVLVQFFFEDTVAWRKLYVSPETFLCFLQLFDQTYVSQARCKMASLHDLYGSWHLYIRRSLFGYSTFFSLYLSLWRAFHVVVKGGILSRVEPLGCAMASF